MEILLIIMLAPLAIMLGAGLIRLLLSPITWICMVAGIFAIVCGIAANQKSEPFTMTWDPPSRSWVKTH